MKVQNRREDEKQNEKARCYIRFVEVFEIVNRVV